MARRAHNKPKKRMSMASRKEREAFYAKLNESLEEFGGFCELPDMDNWDHYEPLFHIARQAHVVRPHENDKNWICVYNMQAEFCMALPEWLLPVDIETGEPVVMSLEHVTNLIEKSMTRLRKQCHKMKPKYGEFEVARVQGRVFLRHIGPVPLGNDTTNG